MWCKGLIVKNKNIDDCTENTKDNKRDKTGKKPYTRRVPPSIGLFFCYLLPLADLISALIRLAPSSNLLIPSPVILFCHGDKIHTDQKHH